MKLESKQVERRCDKKQSEDDNIKEEEIKTGTRIEGKK